MEVYSDCVKGCVPGASLRELHNYSVRALATQCARLGLPEPSNRR